MSAGSKSTLAYIRASRSPRRGTSKDSVQQVKGQEEEDERRRSSSGSVTNFVSSLERASEQLVQEGHRGEGERGHLAQSDREVIEALQARLEEQARQLVNRNITIDAIQRNFERLSDDWASDRDVIGTLRKQLKQAKVNIGALEDMNRENDELREQLRKVREEMKDKSSQGEQTKRALSKEIKAHGEAEEKIIGLQLNLDKSNMEVTRLKGLVKQQKKQYDMLEARFEGSNATLKTVRNQLREQQEENRLLVDEVRTHKEKIKSTSGILEHTVTKSYQQQSFIDTVSAERDAARKEVALAKAEVEMMREARDKAVAEAETQGKEVEELRQEIARLQGLLEESKSEQGAAERSLVHKKDELSNALKDRTEVRRELAEAMENNEKLRQQVRESRKEGMKVKEKLKEAQEALKVEKERVELELSHRDGKLEAIQQTSVARMESLKTQLDEVNRNYEEASEKLKEYMGYGSRMEELAAKEKVFRDSLAKINVSMDAMQASLTCLNCMQLYRNPVTLVPCGHCFCRSCAEQDRDERGMVICQSCKTSSNSGKTNTFFANEPLEDMVSKYEFQAQAMQELTAWQSGSL